MGMFHAPIGRALGRLRRDAQKPKGYDAELHRSPYTYVKTLPGDYFEVFRKRNNEMDPLSRLLCAGRREEIGDHIQMCMGIQEVHMVIYKGASLAGITKLVKKLLYHVKKLPGTAALHEFDKGILYDSSALKKKSPQKLAVEILTLLKKRQRYLRLYLQQTHKGGALHSQWIHRPGAMRRISRG